MIFQPPAFAPPLPYDCPDDVPICDFVLGEQYGRPPLARAPPPFVDGLSGKAYTAPEVKVRVEWLARALQGELGWDPHRGSERERVAGVFAVNTIDTLTVSWAVHRLSGISSPANAAYSAAELAYQLKASKATVLFTCAPLLQTALQAAKEAGISREKIYLIDVPAVLLGGKTPPTEFQTVDSLIEKGQTAPPVEPLQWSKGQGARQIAFLCFSSGTSGLPKGVMISHRNVIANTLQLTTYEQPRLAELRRERGPDAYDVVLGLLPFNHIYGLVVVAHQTVFQGGQVVVLPRFELKPYLQAIADYQVRVLYLVPPIIIAMMKNKAVCDRYKLPKDIVLWTGAAPLGRETAEAVLALWPAWTVRQGFGMTESCTVVCCTAVNDVDLGSCGCLLPGFEARIVDSDGRDVEAYEEEGELVVRGPSVTLGYLDNEAATKEAFVADGWLKSGDKALVRKSAKGNEHIWIVDRMKELIKVKGLQVAPAELEAHLLTHDAVADAAVIPVPDEAAGEVPKAFVVKAASVGLEDSERLLRRDIQRHVEAHKARHKWLRGGVEFVDEIPKSASGKILRRMLRDRERERRRKTGPRL